MIVTYKPDLIGTPRDAHGPGWDSMRLLVKSDGMGFAMTETHIAPGAELHLHYKNHIEACYCLSGTGIVTVPETSEAHQIHAGVLYAPDQHEQHVVKVTSAEPMRLICVFSPALQGDEVHQPDGSYALR